MKRIKYILVLFLSGFFFFSCNEDQLLKEVPLDFYSPENSYNTPQGIDVAIIKLYSDLRTSFVVDKGYYSIQDCLQFGTDFGRDARSPGIVGYVNYTTALTPVSQYAIYWWKAMYQIISESNVIISRIPAIKYPSDEAKNAAIAEASFFRGYAYRLLAHLYGGVPITLEEISVAKRDFTRATRADVYKQAITDLTFASINLPDITHVKADGRVSKEAAFHFLAEVYLATKEWDKSISAASQIINNPNFQLMTQRFGSLKDSPGDVWWDLFRVGNQNRGKGNKEAIWVSQYEDNTAGGGVGIKNERNWGPFYWSIKSPDNVNGFIGPTSKNGGLCLGRLRPTFHAGDSIWKSDYNNDLRNSKYNIFRDYVYDNPKSAYFGKKVSEFPPIPWATRERDFYPYLVKATTPGQHPATIIDPKTGVIFNTPDAGSVCTDQYWARLAETYLFRAEAYLGKGDKVNAAADINMVRVRVNATPVVPAAVNIDYILDERLRELALEEQRRLTLSRLGKCYERTVKYNEWDGPNMKPYHELFPIPFSEIERNTGAVLEQNPGYN
ncbi:MAG: RagB/SusD family nutrient uptake outer membrane protein [Prolixibacteraceae bacterium]|jgi:hypothetical protein|nr:RagB/SusD family nutrient uptake outer membrane protein [Prolixibacteraceae bacterium]